MNLQSLGLSNYKGLLHLNLPLATLVEHSVQLKQGHLTESGALYVKTGKHTGRAAQDKYIVKSPSTENKVWWNSSVREMTPATFQKLKKNVLEYLGSQPALYLTEKSVGANLRYGLGVTLLTASPSHALFAGHLFRSKVENPKLGEFKILHAPYYQVSPSELGTRSETIIVTDFDERTVIVVGTAYAGEIKKSIFSIMNYILPDHGVLPMHAGASQGERGDVSLFFGLSGTGKTTLSTDLGKMLIGDDEHGLSEEGVFNFEGGCYAKTYKLTEEGEPEIYQAIGRFGALLENVVVNEETRRPDFFDKSLGENGRASYPLEFIPERVLNSCGAIPENIFFLSADAFGVLPPVSKLTKEQAMYYFLSGYTSKLAGTEMGVVEPSATFSACFGAPFMVRKPEVYAALLGQYLDRHPTHVWLINTGWHSGPYGEGERFPLRTTRQIIRSIQSGGLKNVPLKTEPVFGLQIPEHIPGVDTHYLSPKSSWKDQGRYDDAAKKLAFMFHKNIENFQSVDRQIIAGGPRG